MAAPPESTTAPNAGGITSGLPKCYAFKSWLQEYAEKADLPAPEYQTVKEGPAHGPVFRSTVAIDGAKYDSLPGFFNRKAAEQSAAEAALMEILESIPTTKRIPADQQTGLWNNLLQEYAQEMNQSIPSYTWTRQASGKSPYTCTIEIGGTQYIGHAGRSKKDAEIKAAWTALLAIKGQLEGRASSATKYIVVPGKRQSSEAEKNAIETLKQLEVKKGGFKRKWNRRKFLNRKHRAVDLEKNETRAAGDVSSVMMKHDNDASKSVQEPSGDTVMLQSGKEPRRAELDSDTAKPDKQARRAELEPDIAMLNPYQEDRRVEQVQGSGTAMLQPDNGARRVEQVPGSDTVMLQHGKEARRVEREPPRDSGMVQPNEEVGCINQEQLGETAMARHFRAARTKKHDSQSRCNLM
ncbi:double-stranded RNA-binding protein 8 isoform X2 [Lolium perenne]|uniref:double-stranded RNA-binding protein 8 isoform X2 n=1 Tax=Lolium perenne TaxID=4522 RepID=UPI0021EAEE6B|nr:double-stranded RNA-binding protein 8-like isoform X2 [Lolium perenne]